MSARLTWADQIDKFGLEKTLAEMKRGAEMRMRRIDRMAVFKRALVHEYGLRIVDEALAMAKEADLSPRRHLATICAQLRGQST